ncbi:hypothetical protein B0T26DRAFT_669972 [Lasiosphaeria miniovina]|uniref:Myb-like DNA-binding domain protein n=1 Tax=Lasiosphaeria miniovina TaxID=1954250 RepID=A0AA40BG50_9PEZI|nr:uncharacterized protein B0T26DRAFT_669972 [Lasiosphaeria miniovina]KAK0733571.1 hypothetical protein B0T26DRAFT_669972 [Lasiosphaeria miniovina]
MERPPKRARVGASSFHPDAVDDEDDVEADELNSRPEDLNARRDPGYRLQKSRAFAALKLKSAFESIFDKYEKDFTGIGDEIDLRTCEVVVDNGHIQSLKKTDTALGAFGNDNDNISEALATEDSASDTASIDEEERILQGKSDLRLSSLRQLGPPPLASHIIPSYFNGPWAGPSPFMAGSTPFMGGPSPFMGAPPLFPGSGSFPPMQAGGGFSMPYGAPPPINNWSEAAWRVPELPPSAFQNTWQPAGTTSFSRGKARMPLISGGDADDKDEDDILMGVSTVEPTEPGPGGVSVPKKLPPQGLLRASDSSEKISRPAASEPKPKPKDANTPTSRTPSKQKKLAILDSGGGSLKPKKDKQTPVTKYPLEAELLLSSDAHDPATPTTSARQVKAPQSRRKRASGEGYLAAVEATPPEKLSLSSQTPARVTEQPDVYIGHSELSIKSATKPRNQCLRVEIVAKRASEYALFRAITPEATPETTLEMAYPTPQNVGEDESETGHIHASPAKARMPTPESESQSEGVAVEVFSRNVLDPAYTFSDEEEPALPKSKNCRRFDRKPNTVIRAHQNNPAPGTVSPAPRGETSNRKKERRSTNHKIITHTPPSGPDVVPEVAIACAQYTAGHRDADPSSSRDCLEHYVLLDKEPAIIHQDDDNGQQQQDPVPSLPTTPGHPEAAATVAEKIQSSKPVAQKSDKENAKRQEAAPATPVNPNKTQRHTTVSSNTRPAPSSRHTGLLSLLSDDDEDELSLGPENFTPSGSRCKHRHNNLYSSPSEQHARVRLALAASAASSSTIKKRKLTLKKGLLLSSHSKKTGAAGPMSSPSSLRSTLARFSATGRGPMSSSLTTAALAFRGSGADLAVRQRRGRSVETTSEPMGSELVQTPGGSMRRCGEGGFRCDRDFCFACL